MLSGSILVIRLSAMGDVALTVPLIRQAARKKHIIILTKPLFSSFFQNIDNVSIVTADTSGAHNGVAGLYSLYRDLRRNHQIEMVIDLHNVIRSRILAFFFRLGGTPVYRIDKGRRAKKRFIKTHQQEGLIHTTERYRKVFLNAGLMLEEPEVPAFVLTDEESEKAGKYLENISVTKPKLIALAPYAMHLTKQWPVLSTKALLAELDRIGNTHVFLFGGRHEREKLIELSSDIDSVSVVAGELSIRDELALISRMDLMISMDSSNLHMAAVSGIRTLSLWGGTHPYIGFGPIGKQNHAILEVSIDELDCRPCTVYGKGDCRLKENRFRCLSDISPEMLIDQLRKMELI